MVSAHVAAQTAVRVEPAPANGIRVDGSLREWPATMASLASAHGAEFRYTLMQDEAALYVGFRARDDRFIRSARYGTDEDVLIFRVASGRSEPVEIWLYAGAGRIRAKAFRLQGGRRAPLGQARIVEEPVIEGDGYAYSLEAALPWRLLGLRPDTSGVRAAVIVQDVDREARPVPTEYATTPRTQSEMPVWLVRGGEEDVFRAFLEAHDLEMRRSSFDVHENVVDDARAERIILIGGYVYVSGPQFDGGRGFGFTRVPGLDRDEDYVDHEFVDLDGDGSKELFLRSKARTRTAESTFARVFDFLSGRGAVLSLSREIARTGEASFTIDTRVDGDAIAFRRSAAAVMPSASFSDAPLALDSRTVAARVTLRSGEWIWEKTLAERPDAGPATPISQPALTARSTSPQTAAPDFDALLTQFRAQRTDAGSLRQHAQFNFVDGARREHVALLERTNAAPYLLVAGGDIEQGRGYLFMELPANASATPMNTDRDGRYEIEVRVNQPQGVVNLIYKVTPLGFERISQEGP